MTDPPPISSTTLSKKKNVTCDTGHVLGGVNSLSKFQLPSSNRLWFMILWRSGGKEWPATPGLSNIGQGGGASHWRVCCQWGLPRLVYDYLPSRQCLGNYTNYPITQLPNYKVTRCLGRNFATPMQSTHQDSPVELLEITIGQLFMVIYLVG